MRSNNEPPWKHGTPLRTGLVLVNLGTPEAPTAVAVRAYLRQFLSDPRVVEIPRWIWWFILHLVILPLRSGKSAHKYASVWTGEGSPLKVHTERQTGLLRKSLQKRGHDIDVAFAMRYGSPSVPDVLDALKAGGCDRILVVPAYPQYSGTTTASIYDAVFGHVARTRNVPELRLVKHYHDHDAYIDALRQTVLAHWNLHGHGEKLVMSFHGVPKRTLLLGDPYHCECHKTARLLASSLGLSEDQYLVTFQSRFGKAEWLQPYTAPSLRQLAKEGVGRVDLICPGFTADCLETLEEIAMEARQDFLTAGGKEFHYIACLNESVPWISALSDICEQHLFGWPTTNDASVRRQQSGEAADSRSRAQTLGALE